MGRIDKQMYLQDLEKLLGSILTVDELHQVMIKADEALIDYEVTSAPSGGGGDSDSDDLVRYFLDAKQAEGKSPKTIRHYSDVLRYLRNYTGITFQRMTIYHIRDYLTKERERGISPRTLNGYRSVYSSFFGWLSREGLIDRNPMNNLTTIKQPKVKKQPLSAVDAAKVAEVATTPRDRALIAFLAATGCRVGEVENANREDIDWESKSLIVCGKGEKERRVLLDDVTAMLLKRYLDSRTDSCPALFAGRGGVRLGIGGIEKVLKKAGKAAGVENVHPHRYRRTFASEMIKKGMPVQEVQLLLGHEKIETTMTYITVDERDVAERYRRLA